MRTTQCVQVKRVRCEASGVLVAKDKAIKRFIVRNIVDASAIRDIQDSSILEGEPTSGNMFAWHDSSCTPAEGHFCLREGRL